MTVALVAVSLVAIALGDIRWLRVAQREHYLTGTVSRFAQRWWFSRPINVILWFVSLLAIVTSFAVQEAVLVIAVATAVGPVGLSLRGRTSKLAWTRRLKTLASVLVAIQLIVVAIAAAAGSPAPWAGLVAAAAPSFVEVALGIVAPWERRSAAGFVRRAKARLASVSPTVVAITGSYGKTSTKVLVAHLLAGGSNVYATPASFNNKAGLSRAINEQLTPGTDVFVAEMGTYGPREIEELCTIARPNVSVLTAVGPVHLERFGSEEAIIAAKSEIFVDAESCVINIDDERLSKVADRLEAEGKTVWRVGTSAYRAVVRVVVGDVGLEVFHGGEAIARLGEVPSNVAPGNLACAIAVALQLGVEPNAIEGRLHDLPSPPHRNESNVSKEGIVIIDDTYNSNPAGVTRALEGLAAAGSGNRRIVVTPGMVELGRRQFSENARFAKTASELATDLVIVGRTNHKALRSGAAGTDLAVMAVSTLPEAVAWIRENGQSGDAVLYANDLPDHFP